VNKSFLFYEDLVTQIFKSADVRILMLARPATSPRVRSLPQLPGEVPTRRSLFHLPVAVPHGVMLLMFTYPFVCKKTVHRSRKWVSQRISPWLRVLRRPKIPLSRRASLNLKQVSGKAVPDPRLKAYRHLQLTISMLTKSIIKR
jgi:hypothetical protein